MYVVVFSLDTLQTHNTSVWRHPKRCTGPGAPITSTVLGALVSASVKCHAREFWPNSRRRIQPLLELKRTYLKLARGTQALGPDRRGGAAGRAAAGGPPGAAGVADGQAPIWLRPYGEHAGGPPRRRPHGPRPPRGVRGPVDGMPFPHPCIPCLAWPYHPYLPPLGCVGSLIGGVCCCANLPAVFFAVVCRDQGLLELTS